MLVFLMILRRHEIKKTYILALVCVLAILKTKGIPFFGVQMMSEKHIVGLPINVPSDYVIISTPFMYTSDLNDCVQDSAQHVFSMCISVPNNTF